MEEASFKPTLIAKRIETKSRKDYRTREDRLLSYAITKEKKIK